MAVHQAFTDTTEIWCPVTNWWADKTPTGNRGPSEPLCSECGQILEEDDLELVPDAAARSWWDQHREADPEHWHHSTSA